MYFSSQREGLCGFTSEVEWFENVLDVPVEIPIDAIERVVFKSGSNNKIELSKFFKLLASSRLRLTQSLR